MILMLYVNADRSGAGSDVCSGIRKIMEGAGGAWREALDRWSIQTPDGVSML